jgi:hypothetical protein
MNAVELRPLGIGEILDVAIKLYFRHFATFLRIALFVVLPVQLLASAITVSASDSGTTRPQPLTIIHNPDGTQTAHFSSAALGALGVVILLTFLANQLATGACFKAVVDGYLGSTPDWRTSIGTAWKRIGSLIWIAILVSIAGGLLLLLCILPGVWFYVGAVIAVPVLFTEDVRGWKAVQRSRELVKGRWWPVFALVIIGGILVGVISAVVGGILGAIGDSGGSWATRFVFGVLSGTITALFATPFAAAYQTILYVDQRVRKEGFDLALFAHRMGSEPPPPTGGQPAWGGPAPIAPMGGGGAASPASPAPASPVQPPSGDVPQTTWEPGTGPAPLRGPQEPPPAQ